MTITEVSRLYDITTDTLRYYERIGIIPPVKRSAGGLRDYDEKDCNWISLAKCMRSAGLPVECLAEYLKLFQQGDETIPARLQLLTEQREKLIAQRETIDNTISRLECKIAKYTQAVETVTSSYNEK